MTTFADGDRVPLVWRPSPLTVSVATCAAVALVLAVLAGRWQLAAFAAPLVGILVAIGAPRDEATIWVRPDPPSVRLFESETAEFTIRAESDAADALLTVEAVVPRDGVEAVLEPGSDASAELQVTAQRWGRYRAPVRVRATTRSAVNPARSMPAAKALKCRLAWV